MDSLRKAITGSRKVSVFAESESLVRIQEQDAQREHGSSTAGNQN